MNLMSMLTATDRAKMNDNVQWFQQLREKNQKDLSQNYFEILYGTASWLVDQLESGTGDKFFLGMAGAQGSGKSTFAKMLQAVLQDLFEISALILSLDDFYLTHKQRVELGSAVHPLLLTRGVPGTHDINLLSEIIGDLRHDRPARIPVFSKAEDDRTGSRLVETQGTRVILCEGWCWGARPVSEDELADPINQLEVTKDADGTWRRFVNDRLKDYQDVFLTNKSIFLAVPDMASVRTWRWQQEQEAPSGSRSMDREAVAEFIMYYERISLRMLRDQPADSALTLQLGDDHEFLGADLNPDN